MINTDLKKLENLALKLKEKINIDCETEVYNNDFAIFLTAVINEEDNLLKIKNYMESFVSVNIHNNLEELYKYFESDNIIYDIYIVLLIDFKLKENLKIEIENDHYYCKKIVLDYKNNLTLKENLKELLLFKKLQEDNLSSANHIDNKIFRSKISKKSKDDKIKNMISNLSVEAEDLNSKAIVESWLQEESNNV
jgi:hypothetical protein